MGSTSQCLFERAFLPNSSGTKCQKPSPCMSGHGENSAHPAASRHVFPMLSYFPCSHRGCSVVKATLNRRWPELD